MLVVYINVNIKFLLNFVIVTVFDTYNTCALCCCESFFVCGDSFAF